MKLSAILLGALATVAAAETCTLIAEDWTQPADAQGNHPEVNFDFPCDARQHYTKWEFAIGNARVTCDGGGRKDVGIAFKHGGGLSTGMTGHDLKFSDFNDGEIYKVIENVKCTPKPNN